MAETAGKIEAGFFRSNLKPTNMKVVAYLVFLMMVVDADAGSVPTCYCNELDKNAQTWRLNLFSKDSTAWRVIEGGARGELTIHRPSGRYKLKAISLRPNTEYALVRHAGKPPFGQVLARGSSNARGELNVNGIWQQWRGKFWVVLEKDLRERNEDFRPGIKAESKAWRPAEYLFESEELPDEK